MSTIMSISQMSKLWPREVKKLSQGHTTNKWWSQDVNTCTVMLDSVR